MKPQFLSYILRFWTHNPALFYGVTLLLGFYASFSQNLVLIVPCCCLWLPLCWTQHWKLFVLSLTLFSAAYGYASAYYLFPDLPERGVSGKGHISIESIRLQKSFFGSKWIYNCRLLNFIPYRSSSIARHIKCTIAIPANTHTKRPIADRDYVVAGTLFKSKSGQYFLKAVPYQPWNVVDDSQNFAEMRFQWKNGVIRWIKSHFSSPYSATFLGGLATGEFDDQWMRQEFSRFGLQHIMAISGFHFAIMVGVLSLLMRLFFSRKLSAIVLLAGMAAYALFLGSNPSIMRAWLMSSLVIGGYLLEKNGSGLNALGFAMIGTLLFDPLLCLSIGFQFSFLVTGAILLIYGTADTYFKQLFPRRPLSEMVEMNSVNQHGYCILTFFRQGLALMFAVNVFALPLTLYYFHQFPWMSLLYNLFFPLLIAGSLGLLILGMLGSWIPVAGSLINASNNAYTNGVLQVTYRMPQSVDYYLTVDAFSVELLVIYLCAIVVLAVVLYERHHEADDEQPFAFV